MRLVVLSVVLAIGAALSNMALAATVPTLSGAYTVEEQEICPAVLTESTNGSGEVTNVATSFAGSASVIIGQVNVTGAAIKGTGFKDSTGGLVQGVGETLTPTDAAQKLTATYTNTATSFTLVTGGSSETYNAIYGSVKKGIAGRVILSALYKDSAGVTCVDHLTLTGG